MKKLLVMVVTAAVGVVSAEDAYLQSNGTQVIDTGYYVNAKTKIEVDFEFTENPNSNYAVFGQQQTSGQKGNPLILYRNGSNQLTVGYCNSSWAWDSMSWTDISTEVFKRRTFIFDSTTKTATLITDGVTTKESEISAAEFDTATKPMAIFGRTKTIGEEYDLCAKMKLYWFKVYEKDDESGEFVLVHDYIPAIDETDGKAKLLDRAGGKKTFFGNALSGNFGYGGDIPTLRDDPHIESDGTQAIDTGYKVNKKTRIEVDFQLTEKVSANRNIFGAFGANPLNFYSYANACYIAYYDSSSKNVLIDTVKTHVLNRHTFVYDVWTDKFILDGQESDIKNGPSTRNTAAATLGIFDRHRAEATGSGSMWTSGRAKMKLYSFKIYERDSTSGEYALVRDYRPVVDTDGKGKMMDIAQNLNVVCDQVDAGAEFAVNAATPRLCEEAYLESDGTQIIDLGYRAKKTSRFEIDHQFLSRTAQDRAFGASGGGQDAELYITGADNLSFGAGDTRYNNGNADNIWAAQRILDNADNARRTVVLDLNNQEYWWPYGSNVVSVIGTKDIADEAVTTTVFGKHRCDATTGVVDYRQAATMRLYAFRIYEADELVHQYLPYKNGDTVGLYDTVTGVVKTELQADSERKPVVTPNPLVYHAGGYNNYEGAVPEAFVVAPKPKYGVSPERSAVISVLAPGAYRYVWKKNGAVVEGADAATLEVAADEVRDDEVYTVQAMYLVDGKEVAGPTAETVVSQTGFMIIVR